MDKLLADLAAQHAELAGVLAGLDAAGWDAPSRCAGWSVSDVVLHLAQTDEMALASLGGTLQQYLEEKASAWATAASVDAGAGLLVDAERGDPAEVVHRRWLTTSEALRAAFAAADLHERVTWVAGQLAVRTLATTRLTECWIHTRDVTTDLPVPARIEHVARLAWRTLPYAFAQAGLTAPGEVAFVLTAPDGGEWVFGDPGTAPTVLRGSAFDLCEVAGQRGSAADRGLTAAGPDAEQVLRLVRTFA